MLKITEKVHILPLLHNFANNAGRWSKKYQALSGLSAIAELLVTLCCNIGGVAYTCVFCSVGIIYATWWSNVSNNALVSVGIGAVAKGKCLVIRCLEQCRRRTWDIIYGRMVIISHRAVDDDLLMLSNDWAVQIVSCCSVTTQSQVIQAQLTTVLFSC